MADPGGSIRCKCAPTRFLGLRVRIPPSQWLSVSSGGRVFFRQSFPRRADPQSRGIQPSVCVFMSLSVIRNNNNPVRLQRVGRRGQTEKESKMQPLRWSRGSVLAFGTQVRGFKPGRSRWIFQDKKILSTPSFGGKVKPSVPCRRFTACIPECYVEVGHFQAKYIDHFSPMQLHLWLLGSLEDNQWRKLEHSKIRRFINISTSGRQDLIEGDQR